LLKVKEDESEGKSDYRGKTIKRLTAFRQGSEKQLVFERSTYFGAIIGF